VQIGETLEGAPITVSVTRVCLEEEAGRAVHGRFPQTTALDFNRAGAPTLHVVSAPGMRSSAEAVAYVRGIRRLVRGVGAGEARLADGSLRVRATLSVRRLGDTALGIPCEVAGAGSLGALRAALEAEFARQCALLDTDRSVERRMMLWDSAAGALVPSRMRGIETHPLCLPEPDLPPLVLTADWIAEQRTHVPARPTARREHLTRTYKLDGPALDVLTADPELADYYESVARAHGDAQTAATWVMGDVLDVVDNRGMELDAFALRVRPADLAELLDMIRDGKLDPTGAKHVFGIMARTGEPAPRVAKRERLWPAPDA
jgi:aspartyl-tRNA(Asn)/glutamyl-tRNA(Gln) amidotransferase subunit B